MLTSKPNCFQKTVISETKTNDCHKLVTTVFRSTLVKLFQKTIRFTLYNFLIQELDQNLIKGDICKTDDSCSKLTEIFPEILKKHAPAKSEAVREN